MARAAFRVGDTIRNRVTGKEGRVVRLYSDLDQSSRRVRRLAYIVRVADKEELWHESDVEPSP